MEKITDLSVSFLLTFAISMVATSATLAGTPDGITPNDEMVCDVLKADGTTKGLYGLCIAYCEAIDSPEDLATPEKIAALPRPSYKLLANYNKKRASAGDVDPQMPCATYYEESACPAWTFDQINSVGTYVASASEGNYQIRVDDAEYESSGDRELLDMEYMSDPANNTLVTNFVQITDRPSRGENKIGMFYNVESRNGIFTRNVYNAVHNMTAEEYDACEADIRQHVMPTQNP